MPNRAAKFGSALIASFIASASFISMSYGETPAADECLSAPKGETPAGGHWFYRVEHPSNRHCWYVRGGAAKSAASTPAPLTKPSSNVATSADMPGSVANARAEYSDPRSRAGQSTGPAAGQFPAALPAVDSGMQAANSQAAVDTRAQGAGTQDTASQGAAPQGAGSQGTLSQDDISHPATPPADAAAQGSAAPGSLVASRWPAQMAALAPATPSQVAPPAAAPDVVADDAPSPVAVQLPAKNNIRVAVADAAPETPLEKPRASTQMMFIVMIGAFSVAGLVASAVGLGGRRKKRARLAQAKRRANWGAAGPARQRSSRFPIPSPQHSASPSIAMAAQRPNIGLPLELRDSEELEWTEIENLREIERREFEEHETQQHDAKVVDMLSRLARSAQV